MKASENNLCTAAAIPNGKLSGALGECQMHSDADDLRKWLPRRWSFEQVFVPVGYVPFGGRGTSDTGEGKRGGEHVLSKARVWIFWIERIHQQGIAIARRSGP